MLGDGKKWKFIQGGTIVFLHKKYKILQGSTLVFDFSNNVIIYTREYPYIFEKYHVKNPEKQGGVICRGVICREPEWYAKSYNKTIYNVGFADRSDFSDFDFDHFL